MIRVFEEQVQAATAAGNQLAIEHLEATRDSLERGVFVLLFGQFEIEIAERFLSRREANAANPDWRQRRGWDVPALQTKRVPFETKLALMMDRQGPPYRKVIAAYGRRNHCAHGGSTAPVGSIDQFVEELYVWQAELRQA
jgi:hypothetical protein